MSETSVKTRTWVSLLVIAGFIGLIAFGLYSFVSQDDLASCGARPTAGQCAAADAIVVVSGGDTAARTDEATALYKRGWASLLIVSGAAIDKSGPSNAEVMRRLAIEDGVAPGNVLVDAMAKNTNQNAAGASQLAQPRGVQSVIVVTSPYHLPRAELLFERQFAEVRSHPSQQDKDWSSRWWLTAHGWRLVGSELVKYALELTRGNFQEAP